MSLEYFMTVKLLTEHHLEFLSLTGGCTGSFESTLAKMPHCWKSYVAAPILFTFIGSLKRDKSSNRKSGKRKNEEENDEDEEDYERLPRKLFVANSNKNMKMILPIKTKQGIIPRMVEDDEGQGNPFLYHTQV